MKIALSVFEIKNNSELEDWGNKLANEHLTEAQISLIEENVKKELAVTFMLGDRKFLIGLMLHEGELQPANMERQINITHKATLKSNKIAKIPHTTIYDIDADIVPNILSENSIL